MPLIRLAAKFEMPDYAMVSLLQVQLIHMNLTSFMPVLMHPEVGPEIKAGEPNPPMSPLQTILVTAGLIDQKLLMQDYQVPPAEWDRDVYPRLLKAELSRQELRRRIAAGEVQPQMKARLSGFSSDLPSILRRHIASMSVARRN